MEYLNNMKNKKRVYIVPVLLIITLIIVYYLYERKLNLNTDGTEYMTISMYDETNIEFTLDSQDDINVILEQLSSMTYSKPTLIYGKGYYIAINIYSKNSPNINKIYFTNNDIIINGIKYKLNDGKISSLTKKILEISRKYN